MNQITLIFSQPWADRLGWTLVYFIWQGAAIALLLAVARIWMRSPRARHAAACLSLGAMALAPVMTFVWLEPYRAARATAIGTVAPYLPSGPSVPIPTTAPGLLQWVVMAWLCGIALLSVRLAAGWISASRVRTRHTRPAPPEWEQTLARLALRMGVARPVRLLVSPRVDVPAVLGWLRPAVLAPVAALSGLPPEHVEALLAHELAHIQRNDYLVNLLQGVIETMLFYHPAVWWVSAQIRTEREHCCDDLAVGVTADVLTYARALAELETCRPARVRTAIAANGGSLLQRIARLIDPTRAQHTLPRPAAAWALSALLAIGIGALAMRTTVQAQNIPAVSRDEIWMDTVKRGELQIEVRGLGKLVSPNLAELKIAETQVMEVRPGQAVTLDLRGPRPLPRGQVIKVHPEVQNGTVTVDVATQGIPPTVGRPPLDVDGTIAIRTLPNVVYVGRPVFGRANSTGSLFRVDPDGMHATRVDVLFGESSVNQIEIRGGLVPGDKVILNDVSAQATAQRIELK